jgi:hypothetical protein
MQERRPIEAADGIEKLLDGPVLYARWTAVRHCLKPVSDALLTWHRRHFPALA